MKSTTNIRAGFLEFFGKNGHEVRPSGSLVPHNDPTLMFANAGMNQFKNVFTGAEKLAYSRAATSQKCVRAGGKHNDLDNVGYTARHHTFFEMLGNFSFGDYFKETAIELAWTLLTKEFGLNPEKLCVTVYHDDETAWNHWKKLTGFADHKIIRISTNDNFWSMGDTGPCGPCSEIFYDHGDKIPGGPPGSADADGDRFIEIWNLVFMQYEQQADGTRVNLPKPSIDTGMGLERMAAVMQGVHSNYEIDIFKALIADIKDNAAKLGAKPASEAAPYQVLADHLRSSCFLIADGVLPSNEGRGYVLRRIMRRAMRYAHQLGCKDPLMFHLVPTLVAQMGAAYPELARAQATITDNLRQEEDRFKQTLERGLKLLEEAIISCEAQSDCAGSKGDSVQPRRGSRNLSGEIAFKLYDTYGFPLDLTQDILRSRGMEVDTDGFEKSMEGQRDMARAAHKGSGDTAVGKIWFELKEKFGATKFLGYDEDESEAKVLAIIKNGELVERADVGDAYIVLDQTPFYGESGGQVGDTGMLFGGLRHEDLLASVKDTIKPIEDLIVHKVLLDEPLSVGDSIFARIDDEKRGATRANHSATHLLHKALRDQLGDHVTQKGSLVEPEGLRFDFSNPKAVSPEEIAIIERNVNTVIKRNTEVKTDIMTPDEAIKAGAMALFGEKYGDKVRMLSIGVRDEERGANTSTLDARPYSVELCGGTHVRRTGDIGLFKITSEGSVASGIRRIEAVTGEGVRSYFTDKLRSQQEQLSKLQSEHARLSGELSSVPSPLGGGLGRGHDRTQPNNAPLPASPLLGEEIVSAPLEQLFDLFDTQSKAQLAAIEKLQDENKKLNKELAEAKKQAALGDSGAVNVEKVGAVNFIGKVFDGLEPKELRAVAEGYLKQADVVAVATNVEGKASVVVGVNKAITERISAVTLVQAAVAELGGKGGGGRPEMAQGGGPEADKLAAALDKIKLLIQ